MGGRRQDRTFSTSVAGRKLRKLIVVNLLLLILIAILLYRVYKSLHLVKKPNSSTHHPNMSGDSKKQKATAGKEAVDAEFQVIEDK